MNQKQFDRQRLERTYQTVRDALLAERTGAGHWVGHLASSALSTATAVSALSVFRKKNDDAATLEKIDTLLKNGIEWLVARQQRDGGWGDTEQSPSNPSTTLLVQCAILLAADACKTEPDRNVLNRANLYVRRYGGIKAIEKRYGGDRTFSVPILMNAALAGLVPWSDVPALPFELAWFPQSLFRLLKLPVVSYAIPALVAIGQVIHEKNPTKNFLRRKIRDAVRKKTLEKILLMQPESGGFLEATPLTAFVVMSLSACNANIVNVEHPIIQNGVRFLFSSVREDGSWPIDTNLSCWVTTLAVNALQEKKGMEETLSWILSKQHRKRHPFTGAAPGGWAWTDLSGGVPDVDDTAGALLALKTLLPNDTTLIPKETMEQICSGIRQLVSLQNNDGGWPTFCKGWNRFPFDRSGVDLTAHAIRAFLAWKNIVPGDSLRNPMNRAVSQGAKFLLQSQRKDGSWLPLWFGNQLLPEEENPFYGTAKVLLALTALRQEEKTTSYDEAIFKALRFAVANTNQDGGFGRMEWPHDLPDLQSSVEETALMLDALAPLAGVPEFQAAVPRLPDCVTGAMHWLVEQVETGRFTRATPIGLYFTKLWYHENLYPVLFTAAALGGIMNYEL
ncbi:MAG: squalene--hopene cyclase [Planctomycetaceae bacterium]|nr:squalene--hopene cyclase [Planctomycetaceae bacterium]